MFVDSHAHLDGERFDSDRDAVIARAGEAGVQAIVAIGNGDGPGQVDCGIRLAEKYDFIYATLGIHPHEARLADEDSRSGHRSVLHQSPDPHLFKARRGLPDGASPR